MNHLKDLRLKTGIRQEDLAMEAGVSRSAIVRMEALTYPNPLPSVISALSEITGESSARLTQFYLSDVSDHRYFSGECWRLSEVSLDFIEEFVPRNAFMFGKLFEVLRKQLAVRAGESTSQIHFCNAFSIHPAVLSKYESGATNHLPSGVLDALLGAGLVPPIVDYLAVSPAFNGVPVYHD